MCTKVPYEDKDKSLTGDVYKEKQLPADIAPFGPIRSCRASRTLKNAREINEEAGDDAELAVHEK